jgi:hypothetical protein
MLKILVLMLLRSRVETFGRNTSLVTLKRKPRLCFLNPTFCGVVLTGMPKVGTMSCQLFTHMLGGPSRPIHERCKASHSSVPFLAKKSRYSRMSTSLVRFQSFVKNQVSRSLFCKQIGRGCECNSNCSISACFLGTLWRVI